MDRYYILCENWSLEVNQWTILFGISTVLISIIGFSIAFIIYFKQRADSAEDAYNFFNNSLPNLQIAIKDTISNLQDFIDNLREDNFANPTIPSSLNNNIIEKINLINLKRYYLENKTDKLEFLEQLIIDSDFYGTYQNYFVNELNFFRERYLNKEEIYNKWQLLRSNMFFSSITDDQEQPDYKTFFSNWVKSLNNDRDVFNFSSEGIPESLKSRKTLIRNYIINLARDIFPFIETSEKANNVNLLANQVYAAYKDMDSITNKLIEVFQKDIAKFKKIDENIEKLLNNMTTNK